MLSCLRGCIAISGGEDAMGSVGDEPAPASIKLDHPSWSRSSKDLSSVRIWCPEEDKAKEFSSEDEGNPSSSPDGNFSDSP